MKDSFVAADCLILDAESGDIVRSLMEQFDGCAYLFDREGRCVAANSVFRRWLNRTNKEIVGPTLFDIWPSNVAEYESTQHQLVWRGARIESEEERPRGARSVLVRLRLAPLCDRAGNTCGVFAVFREVAQNPLNFLASINEESSETRQVRADHVVERQKPTQIRL